MRKRLRKKLRLKEFEDTCIPVAYRLQASDMSEQDAFLDRFLWEAIILNGLQFGGGYGTHGLWTGLAESSKRGVRVSVDQRDAVARWLAAQPEVVSSLVGDIVAGPAIERMLDAEPRWFHALLADDSPPTQHGVG